MKKSETADQTGGNEIREIRELLDRILGSSTMFSIVATDLRGKILFWSEGAEKIFGYSAEEMIGGETTRLHPPDEPLHEEDDLLERLSESAAGPLRKKVRRLTKDGQVRNILLEFFPLVNDAGEAEAIVEIGIDVTDREKKEGEISSLQDRLRQARDTLDMIYRASSALSSTSDLDQFLEVVVAELAKTIEVEAAGVLLYEERGGDFYWREVQDEKRILLRAGSDSPLPIDPSVIHQSFESGEPAILHDIGTGAPLIRNALLVPLNTREKTVGMLVLANKETGPVTEEDMHICRSTAAVVAISVENAEFFDKLAKSYRKLEGLDRTKSKVLDRLSHELKTPLAIIEGSLKVMERKLGQMGTQDFDRPLERVYRQLKNLERLESQVESMMDRGYNWEREMISGLVESAASLSEVRPERTPEMEQSTDLILRTLEEAFPAKHEQWRHINIKEFGETVLERVRSEAESRGRRLNLVFDLDNDSDVVIPDLVLYAIIEGLVRNAVEATPDNGKIEVRGYPDGDIYIFTVKDSGIGIPEEDKGLVFEGFYQVQETESYSTGRPYSFDAGGKGMDLFRIKMFSRIYGFDLYFRSERCQHLIEELRECAGDPDQCPCCDSLQDCVSSGGTEFEVDFPLARKKR